MQGLRWFGRISVIFDAVTLPALYSYQIEAFDCSLVTSSKCLAYSMVTVSELNTFLLSLMLDRRLLVGVLTYAYRKVWKITTALL